VSVITTHHNTLKLFGARTEGAINAAMEFDPGTFSNVSVPPGKAGQELRTGYGVADRRADSVVRDGADPPQQGRGKP